MSGRRHSDVTLSRLRSALTNGSCLFLGDADETRPWARRYRDVIADLTTQLGGVENVSAAEDILIRRAAMLCLQLELMERNWARDNDGQAGPKSLNLYQRNVNTLRRALETIGLQRRPRDITPSLKNYVINGHASADEEEHI